MGEHNSTMAEVGSISKTPIARLIFAGCLAFAAVSAASAQSLRDMRMRDTEESALDAEVAYTRSVCNNSISATIDWRTAADWPENLSLAEACDGALGALEAFCRRGDGQSRAVRVSRFVCAADGSGAALNGGTLRYGASPGDNGFSDTKAVLESSL